MVVYLRNTSPDAPASEFKFWNLVTIIRQLNSAIPLLALWACTKFADFETRGADYVLLPLVYVQALREAKKAPPD